MEMARIACTLFFQDMCNWTHLPASISLFRDEFSSRTLLYSAASTFLARITSYYYEVRVQAAVATSDLFATHRITCLVESINYVFILLRTTTE